VSRGDRDKCPVRLENIESMPHILMDMVSFISTFLHGGG
jgi:hypothetical protein